MLKWLSVLLVPTTLPPPRVAMEATSPEEPVLGRPRRRFGADCKPLKPHSRTRSLRKR